MTCGVLGNEVCLPSLRDLHHRSKHYAGRWQGLAIINHGSGDRSSKTLGGEAVTVHLQWETIKIGSLVSGVECLKAEIRAGYA